MLTRRLYHQIYLTIVASLIIVVVVSGVLWSVFGRDRFNRDVFEIAARMAEISLPEAGTAAQVQKQTIDRLGQDLSIDITLYDDSGMLIASHGDLLPNPEADERPGKWQHERGGRTWSLQLSDGRSLIVNFGRRGPHRPLLTLILFFSCVAVGVGLGAYPFVRRLTRRLERLQEGVERMGAGDLAARVEVNGRDEVARLAECFNDAAQKIDDLVSAHRLLLANASHELRTPLARIRLGVEMIGDEGNPERREALQQDIAELDVLIDEILLMSRLDAGSYADRTETVDFVALVAEECSRFEDCTLSGSTPIFAADRRLLRRLVSNLLENAHQHGAAPVTVELRSTTDDAILTITDSGEGIKQGDQEKVFQPFFRASDRQNVKGYGLGLPLVRQIAEAHGGQVTIVAPSSIRVELALHDTD